METNSFVPEANMNLVGGEGVFPAKIPSADKPVSRRLFISRAGKIIALGALAHFTLLTGKAFAAEDACPGGLPDDDTCNPPDNSDLCPGDAPPADNCPSDGNRDEDKCNTGGSGADTCDAGPHPESDQCESGLPADDQCPDMNAGDNCPDGRSDTDECAPNGTDAQGDQCPGGDPTGGLDTCEPEGSGPSGGDDCSEGSFHTRDDCKESHPDECTWISDDFCPNGTNTPSGDGGDDKCTGITGSDQCTDGTDATDVCTGSSWGLEDTCPGGGTDVDICTPGVSDDYCVGGQANNDECVPPPSDADQCPGGGPNEDKCPTGDPPEDECTGSGGCAGGDQEGAPPPTDTCTPNTTPSDACTMASPDNPE